MVFAIFLSPLSRKGIITGDENSEGHGFYFL